MIKLLKYGTQEPVNFCILFLVIKIGLPQLAISSDNSFIVTGSHDETAKIWNARTGELLHTLSGHQGYH